MTSKIAVVDRAPLPPIALPLAIAAFDGKPFVAFIGRLASPIEVVDDDDHHQWWYIDPQAALVQMTRLDNPSLYLHLDDFDASHTMCEPAHPEGAVQVTYRNTPEAGE